MREILFRAFHPCDGPDTIVVDGEKVKGKWVYGYVVKHLSAIQIGNDYSPWYIHVPPVDPDDNGGVFNVIPSTVGQYTGLTDKTGKRVFENDVLNVGHGRTDSVVWAAGCFHMKNALMFSELSYGVDMYEVIGTVFDGEAKNA